MILSREAQGVASFLRSTCELIYVPVAKAFEQSVPGSGSEVAFFRKLIRELSNRLGEIQLPIARFSCRIAEVHQKPIVKTNSYRCELGDLLVVVKYHPLSSQMEAKSVLFQAKMSRSRSRWCKLDQKQLDLLRRWPPFEFGRERDGGPRRYDLRPRSLEFGSYMLEPRNAAKNSVLSQWRPDIPLEYGHSSGSWERTFGLCPTAWDCFWDGPEGVELRKESHLLPDVDAIVGQVIFHRGEHHSNSGVRDLVEALYRYVGLESDPPKEFEGFVEESEDDGFAVLEVNVEQMADLYEYDKKERT